jgi:carbohydrate-binding DOMON domain-containing protein
MAQRSKVGIRRVATPSSLISRKRSHAQSLIQCNTNTTTTITNTNTNTANTTNTTTDTTTRGKMLLKDGDKVQFGPDSQGTGPSDCIVTYVFPL